MQKKTHKPRLDWIVITLAAAYSLNVFDIPIWIVCLLILFIIVIIQTIVEDQHGKFG